MDENHADCILRACSVHLIRTAEEPEPSIWGEVADSLHEYVAWRAYDNKKVRCCNKRKSCEREGADAQASIDLEFGWFTRCRYTRSLRFRPRSSRTPTTWRPLVDHRPSLSGWLPINNTRHASVILVGLSNRMRCSPSGCPEGILR